MIGLVVAGPWLTLLGSRLTARHTRRPAGLIAARRLSDNPHAAFRAVSGVVLAVFVASCAIGIITTIVASNSNAGGVDAADARSTILRDFSRTPEVDDSPTAVPPDARHDLEAIAGVDSVTAIHAGATDTPTTVDGVLQGRPRQYIACADLAATPALGHCPSGAQVVSIEADFGGAVIDHTTPMSDITWPAAEVTTDQLATMPIDTIVITTDGTTAAIEHARTTLERVFPRSLGYAPETVRERNARSSRQIDRYRQLANVVLLASLPIAGCSLAVCIAGGLAERRRPFSLLRLTGAPLGMLRRVVSLEAAVPLLLSVVVAAGAGLLAAALFLHAQLQQTLQAPTLSYYTLIIGGVARLAHRHRLHPAPPRPTHRTRQRTQRLTSKPTRGSSRAAHLSPVRGDLVRRQRYRLPGPASEGGNSLVFRRSANSPLRTPARGHAGDRGSHDGGPLAGDADEGRFLRALDSCKGVGVPPIIERVEPVLNVRDVAASTMFYARLGFVETFRDDPDAPMFVVVRRDGAVLALQWHDFVGIAGDRPTVRFPVDDADALSDEFGELPDRTAVGDTPWGTREFHVRDADGNGLQFYRDL